MRNAWQLLFETPCLLCDATKFRQAHFTQQIHHASGLYKDIRMAQIGNVLPGFWVFSHKYLYLCGALGELCFLHWWVTHTWPEPSLVHIKTNHNKFQKNDRNLPQTPPTPQNGHFTFFEWSPAWHVFQPTHQQRSRWGKQKNNEKCQSLPSNSGVLFDPI